MRLHILVRKGVLGFALAGLLVSSAAAQAQDKEPAKDAAKAEMQVKRQCRKMKTTKQANKTHKPKICPLCVPGFPTNGGPRDSQILPPVGSECSCPPNFKEKIASRNLIPFIFSV